MTEEGFGPALHGGGDLVDRTYDERWGGDRPSSARDDGPVLKGRRRRFSLWKILKGLLSVALVLVVLALVAGTALGVVAAGRIGRTEVAGLADAPGVTNVLVVGSDSREGFSPEQLQALGTEAVDGQRTDTIFLLSTQGGATAILSFPRDLFVTDCNGNQGRINAAYATGGPSCLVQTVTATTGIAIDSYVEVNLFGFAQIVDAVGGVPVFLDQPLQDVFAGVDLPAGCTLLDGRQAVGFVRARHVDDDLGRIARQQRFLKSLADTVISANTLVNVPRLFAVASAAGGSLTADQGLGILELVQLARAARGLAGSGLATYTSPGDFATIGGAAVIVPNDEARALWGRFADTSILEVAPEAEVAMLQPGDVPIEVLNGVGSEGLAARAREFLAARGFVVTSIGNSPPAQTTVVLHPPGQEAAAALVAQQIPGATPQPDETVSGLVLILGPDADLTAPAPPPPTNIPEPPPPGDNPLGSAPVPEGCG